MISCTEFIPLYSEFFKYLEKRGGADAVMEYWYYISDNSIGDKTNPNSLASFIERADSPFDGAINYWNHTLTEEACDLYKVIDPKKRHCYSHMRHCPSRGMLNELEHVEPYHNYCKHCDIIYQRVLDKYGIVHEMDFSKTANAECTSFVYEKGNRPDADITNIEAIPTDETMTVIDMKSEDNKYLHRDFHLLGDLALKYCGETFGNKAVIEFLTDYTLNYYSPQIKDIKERGLIAIKEWIERIYEVEEASELLDTELTDTSLTVNIAKSPVIEYMRSLNQQPSKYYVEETRTLYHVIAEACNLNFFLIYYNEDGTATFKFCVK